MNINSSQRRLRNRFDKYRGMEIKREEEYIRYLRKKNDFELREEGEKKQTKVESRNT